MQKWEYVKLHAKLEEHSPDFELRYLTTDGRRVERPPSTISIPNPVKGLFGTVKERSATDEDRWNWFYSKIAELGQDGWEMIAAPDANVGGSTAWSTRWIIWFKRPIS